jgi:transcriptional regulator with XRE-family HTH domain
MCCCRRWLPPENVAHVARHFFIKGLRLAALAEEQSVTKSEMAARMKTSRAAVDRLLDADNPSVTLTTLGKAARALGRKVKIELAPA